MKNLIPVITVTILIALNTQSEHKNDFGKNCEYLFTLSAEKK